MFSGPCAAARTRRCDGNHPPVLERLTDPIIPKDRKGVSSRMIIDACRPFEWMANFPPAAEIGAEYQKNLMEKWRKELFS
jgi:hypothetical protein